MAIGNGTSTAPAATGELKFDDHLEQIKLLFDYTKFHIGLYTTLAGVLIAAMGSNFARDWHVCRALIGGAVFFIALAGLFGGIVASSLPYLVPRKSLALGRVDSNTDNTIYDLEIGPLTADKPESKLSFLKAKLRTYTHLEHAAFWIAIVLVLLPFAPALREPANSRTNASSVEVNGYESVKVNR